MWTDTLIIGAGPTGLSAAYHYQGDYVIVEKEDRVGGLCRSISDRGFVFDYAGHIFFTGDPYVSDVLAPMLLGDNIHWQYREAWVYSQRAYMIPEAGRGAKGTLINAFLALQPEEYVTAIAAVPSFEDTAGYFVLCTRRGRIKRVPVSAFAAVRSNGLMAMSLDEDDYLGWVRPSSGTQDVIVVTRNGMSIRFNEGDVRVMGRPAAGVSAIRLRGGDEVASVDVIDDPDKALLVVTEYGYGKRTPLREYSQQRRYGFGVHTLRNLQKTGRIIGARVVTPDDSLTLITAGGVALRTEVSSINLYGRTTSGVKLIHLPDDDVLVSMALVSGEEGSPGEGPAAREAALAGDDYVLLDDEDGYEDDEQFEEYEDAPNDEVDDEFDGYDEDSGEDFDAA